MKDSQFYQIMTMFWLVLSVVATLPHLQVISFMMLVLNAVRTLQATYKEKKQ